MSDKKSLSEIRELLTDGLVIKISGGPTSGKDTAFELLQTWFKDATWSVEIIDKDNGELLVIAPSSIRRAKMHGVEHPKGNG